MATTTPNGNENGNENGNNGTAQNYLGLQQAQKMRRTIQNISQLLNTGLTAETLDICIRLCEAGVHPQALADIINSVKSEMDELNKDNF